MSIRRERGIPRTYHAASAVGRRVDSPRIGILVLCVLAAGAYAPPIAAALQEGGRDAGAPRLDRAGNRCHLPHPPGQTTVPLTVGGQSRPFLLFVPAAYDGRGRLPLVLNLHASGFNGEQQMEMSQMSAVADRRGFAVAAPNGAVAQGPDSYAWNVPGVPLLSGTSVPPGTPDDERYLLAVMRKVKKRVCTASKRIYLTGYSGGGRMSSQMACDFSPKIAAIAPVAGLRTGVPARTAAGAWKPSSNTCSPKDAVPVLAFHGTADPVNRYGGNDDPRWGYGVERALSRWARLNRCRRGAATIDVTSSVDLVSYSKCRDTATVSLYRQEGAGHTWPGSTGLVIGPIDRSINASPLIWKFFRHHTLAERR